MKALRIIGRSIRDAFKSVFRNFSLSIASILCATITLLVVAIVFVVAANVNNATESLEQELSIIVYVEKKASSSDIEYLEGAIKNVEGVNEVVFISNEERVKDLGESNASLGSLIESYETNPLLNSFTVYVTDSEKLDVVTNEIRNMDFVDSANYGDEAVDTILSVFDVVKTGTLVVVVALIFVTAFLITNTIKLTIYSRRNEIEIMRLVGASNTAIKMPFVFEGFTIGLLGSLIPIITVIYGYIIVYAKLNGKIITDIISLINPYNFIFYIALIIAGLGAIIGMFGSLLAVRKYLKI